MLDCIHHMVDAQSLGDQTLTTWEESMIKAGCMEKLASIAH